MTDRQTAPKQQKSIPASAVFFVMAAIFAAPALAATSIRVPCKDISAPTLDVSLDALITAVVSHDIAVSAAKDDDSVDDIEMISSASLLAPRAEAAIRDAFEGSESAPVVAAGTDLVDAVLTPPMAGAESQTEAADEDDVQQPESGMNTRLPGVSDDAMSRYKKQMFRRDI